MLGIKMELKNKKREYIKLITVLSVLLFILGGFLLYVSFPLLGTKTAVLATQPVDPFDLIRGQYIIIRYDINTIPLIEGAEIGDEVYVSLKEDEKGIHRLKTASLEFLSKDELFIKGNVKSVGEERMTIEYGIEQYFFERNARFDTREMDVKVKISNSGRARIVDLLQDGKPIDIYYENKTLTM
jgi:uncharacterized membrane-anchored protein